MMRSDLGIRKQVDVLGRGTLVHFGQSRPFKGSFYLQNSYASGNCGVGLMVRRCQSSQRQR